MRITRGTVFGIFVILVVIAVIVGASEYQKKKDIGELARRISSQESGSSALSVEELKTAIAAYEKRIERHVEDAAKTATYWKLLAIRLMDRGLNGEALEALEQAIYYSPEDSALHCYTGIAAGIMAKSLHVFPGRENRDRERYFALAEKAYLRAIELDSRNLRARYGLGVLYVFELNMPEEAIPHLRQYLEISRNDVDVMFVMARAHYMLRDFRAALDLYDRIITLSGDEQKRIDAHNNRQLVMEQMYG